jgi:hypothetical protein
MENDSTVPPHILMSQWVVYAHPRDYADKYVLRRWDLRRISGEPPHGRGPVRGDPDSEEPVMVPTDEMALATTLEEIRKQVPPGLFRLRRFADDDPCIVEVWV